MSNFQFQDNSGQIKRQLMQASQAGMEAALLVIEADAKSRARVDSGELRDKIDHTIDSGNSELIGKVGSPNEHAVYNEFGTGEFAENGAGRKGGWSYQAPDGKWYRTKGMRPQPFIRPAFRNNKKTIKNKIGDAYSITFGTDI